MFNIFVEKCYYFINDAYFYFEFDWRNTENKTLGEFNYIWGEGGGKIY